MTAASLQHIKRHAKAIFSVCILNWNRCRAADVIVNACQICVVHLLIRYSPASCSLIPPTHICPNFAPLLYHAIPIWTKCSPPLLTTTLFYHPVCLQLYSNSSPLPTAITNLPHHPDIKQQPQSSPTSSCPISAPPPPHPIQSIPHYPSPLQQRCSSPFPNIKIAAFIRTLYYLIPMQVPPSKQTNNKTNQQHTPPVSCSIYYHPPQFCL